MIKAADFMEGGQKVMPVLHLKNGVSYLEEVEKVRDIGADGVFLIDHSSPNNNTLDEAIQAAKTANPDFLIGANYLRIADGLAALMHIWLMRQNDPTYLMPDMIWSDRVLAQRGGKMSRPAPYTEVLVRDSNYPQLAILFGSIAFKYTDEYTENPVLAANLAKWAEPMVDVVVTSGPATGSPATSEKISAIKKAISKPVAVASGISASNVHLFPDADVFMVSSSIETSPMSGVISRLSLEGLIKTIRKNKGA